MYSNHIITRNSIQIAELAFGGTGLCFYHVRGVDGSCAKHSTVECYTVIYAATNHTYYYYYYYLLLLLLLFVFRHPHVPSLQA